RDQPHLRGRPRGPAQVGALLRHPGGTLASRSSQTSGLISVSHLNLNLILPAPPCAPTPGGPPAGEPISFPSFPPVRLYRFLTDHVSRLPPKKKKKVSGKNTLMFIIQVSRFFYLLVKKID